MLADYLEEDLVIDGVKLLVQAVIERLIGTDHQGAEVAPGLFAQRVDDIRSHEVWVAGHF